MAETFTISQRGMGVNYGLNKVRFMSPVPAGSRVRARVSLVKVERIEKNGLQNTWQVTIEREGIDKPVCVAESIGRVYP
jgi:acyl dehydratase